MKHRAEFLQKKLRGDVPKNNCLGMSPKRTVRGCPRKRCIGSLAPIRRDGDDTSVLIPHHDPFLFISLITMSSRSASTWFYCTGFSTNSVLSVATMDGMH